MNDEITVGPFRAGYVRVFRWMSNVEDRDLRVWRCLRRVLAKFGADREAWQHRKNPYSTDEGEKFIDVPIDPDKRQLLVADLEAAGFDVIDDEGKKKLGYAYREGKMKTKRTTVKELKAIVRSVIRESVKVGDIAPGRECPQCGGPLNYSNPDNPEFVRCDDCDLTGCEDCMQEGWLDEPCPRCGSLQGY